MPESLSATLDLSTTEATSEINRLADLLSEQLASAASSFADAFAAAVADLPPLTPEVDTSTVTEALDTSIAGVDAVVEPAVVADTTDAQSAIEDLSGTEITIPVNADTSDAQAAIDDLAGSTGAAGQAMDATGEKTKSLAGNAAVLTGVTGLATGEFGGLKHIMEGTNETLGGLALRGGAVVGAVGLLTAKGTEAASAQQRFNTILGDSAEKVEHIHVGNLTAGLSELGLKLGTTESQMQQTTASLFQFATVSGADSDKAVEFTNNINALAARAVALNPALGEVSDVAETMSTRLARGGRFAASYGISLTALEISTRAQQDTGKKSAAELTIWEKAAAGAELASEKYGNSLNETVAKGAKNATLEQRSLKAQLDETLERIGKPLVAPMLNLLKDSIPIAEELGTAIGQLAEAALPALDAAVQVVAPVLELLLGTMKQLGIQSTATGAAIGFMVAGPAGALAGALLGLAGDLGIFGGSADKAKDSVGGLATAIDKLSAQDALRRFYKEVETQMAHAEAIGAQHQNRMGNELRVFRELANADVGAAQRIIDALDPQSSKYARFSAILGEVSTKQKTAAANQDAAKHSTDTLAQSTEALTKAYNDNLKALDAKDDALRAQSDATFAALHAEESERDAIDNLTGAYKDAIDSGKTQAQATEAQNRALLSAREAILRAADAQGDLAEKTDTSGNAEVAHQAKIEATINHLTDVKNSLAPGSPLIQYIDDYIVKLRDEIPAAVTTKVDVDTTPAEASLRAFQGEVKAAGGYDIFTLGAGREFPGQAAGGPVSAGMTYLVGEQGPELFTPNVSGNITPNGGFSTSDPAAIARAIADAINTGAMGGVRVENLHVESLAPDPVALGLQVARQLRAAQYLTAR